MRLQLATFLLMAGTIAACSSNPPPPPPMAMNEPAPAMQAPTPPPPQVEGTYRGTGQAASDDRRCRAPRGNQTVRVRNGAFTLLGQRASVAPDGTIKPAGRRSTVAGNITGDTMDVNVSRGRCTFHYSLGRAV